MRNSHKYEGLFFPSEIEATGHVRLRNNNADVSLVGDLYGHLNKDLYDIHGKLPDGRQLSLIECIKTDATKFHNGEKRAVEISVYPHFVVVGHEPISSTDAKITKLTYQCEKAHLFCEYANTFQTLHPSPEALDALIDAEHEKLKEKMAEDEWVTNRRMEALGEHPLVAFFDGNHDIATVDMPSGKLSIWNGPSYGMGSPKGIKIKNTIFHTIEFHKPQTLRKAVHVLKSVHQFYELILGARQSYKKIQLTLEGMEEAKYSPAGLHWNRCNRRIKKRQRDVHPTDILVLASTERVLFETVLANWMSTSPSMEASRFRFFNGLLTNMYSYDRLIGAANMYDLLPEERVPTEEELSRNLSIAVTEARATFRKLDHSSARDSILSALGRAGKPSLKTKILHRADIVNKAMGMRFQKLDVVCHHAVLCRNHYVHGSKAGFDYDENFSSFAYLTDTLEFIFAAADLIECDWNPQKYLSRHGAMSHFVGRYIINYELNLNALEKVIGKPD